MNKIITLTFIYLTGVAGILTLMNLYYIFITPKFETWTILLILPVDIYILLNLTKKGVKI